MELGGKDAMIVDDDADVVAAADAAVWGAMSNAGQTCIGIERVYATERRLRPVRRRGHRAGREAAPGFGRRGHLRADDHGRRRSTSSARHVDDALDRAAAGRSSADADRAGSPARTSSPRPCCSTCPRTSAAVREETFGPTLTVTKVRDAEEALELANATVLRPGRRRCSPSRRRAALDLARRMRSGMTSVNSVLTFASVPALPFGGVGDSGFGRIHGEDGLREFTRAKAITRQRVALPVNLMSFSRPGVGDRRASRASWA